MFDRGGDRFQHALSVHHDIEIAEAKNAIAFGCEKGVPPHVAPEMGVLEMLPTVDFDNQVVLVANEIDDVGADGRLAPEACTAKSMRSDEVPDSLFCFGHLAAQQTRASAHLRLHAPYWLFRLISHRRALLVNCSPLPNADFSHC